MIGGFGRAELLVRMEKKHEVTRVPVPFTKVEVGGETEFSFGHVESEVAGGHPGEAVSLARQSKLRTSGLKVTWLRLLLSVDLMKIKTSSIEQATLRYKREYLSRWNQDSECFPAGSGLRPIS